MLLALESVADCLWNRRDRWMSAPIMRVVEGLVGSQDLFVRHGWCSQVALPHVLRVQCLASDGVDRHGSESGRCPFPCAAAL